MQFSTKDLMITVLPKAGISTWAGGYVTCPRNTFKPTEPEPEPKPEPPRPPAPSPPMFDD